jgi:hypothetical protein
MKIMMNNPHCIEFIVCYFCPLWVVMFIDDTVYGQTGIRFSGPNQVDYHSKADERFPTPILADERKKPMFNFVPFTRSRREMQNRDFFVKLVGQFLQFHFPEPVSVSIATTAIRGYKESVCLGISHLPEQPGDRRVTNLAP